MSFEIKKADKKSGKKYVVIPSDVNKKLLGKNKIAFGASGYNDFIKYSASQNSAKAAKKRDAYIKRHQNEDWNDLSKAGTWARYILWNKPNLKQSVEDMEKKFDIEIKIK